MPSPDEIRKHLERLQEVYVRQAIIDAMYGDPVADYRAGKIDRMECAARCHKKTVEQNMIVDEIVELQAKGYYSNPIVTLIVNMEGERENKHLGRIFYYKDSEQPDRQD